MNKSVLLSSLICLSLASSDAAAMPSMPNFKNMLGYLNALRCRKALSIAGGLVAATAAGLACYGLYRWLGSQASNLSPDARLEESWTELQPMGQSAIEEQRRNIRLVNLNQERPTFLGRITSVFKK